MLDLVHGETRRNATDQCTYVMLGRPEIKPLFSGLNSHWVYNLGGQVALCGLSPSFRRAFRGHCACCMLYDYYDHIWLLESILISTYPHGLLEASRITFTVPHFPHIPIKHRLSDMSFMVVKPSASSEYLQGQEESRGQSLYRVIRATTPETMQSCMCIRKAGEPMRRCAECPRECNVIDWGLLTGLSVCY